jgi:hypothetical protein
MNSVLKNVAAFAIALILVLTLGFAVKRVVNCCSDSRDALATSSLCGVEDQDTGIISKPMLTSMNRLSACGGWKVISPIPACIENTTCPLD